MCCGGLAPLFCDEDGKSRVSWLKCTDATLVRCFPSFLTTFAGRKGFNRLSPAKGRIQTCRRQRYGGFFPCNYCALRAGFCWRWLFCSFLFHRTPASSSALVLLRRRCRFTCSLHARSRAGCGRPAIGPTATMATTGFLARGFPLPGPACYGPPTTGDGKTAIISSMRATGGRTSATMAA